MPLLQQIIQQFDRELDRLHALRELVVALGRTPTVAVQIHSCPTLATTPEEPVMAAVLQLMKPSKPAQTVRAKAGKPREPRTLRVKRVSQPRAFAAAIPSGPVVFNPVRLAEERAKREQGSEMQALAEPVHTAEDLDALSRSLAARWTNGPMQ